MALFWFTLPIKSVSQGKAVDTDHWICLFKVWHHNDKLTQSRQSVKYDSKQVMGVPKHISQKIQPLLLFQHTFHSSSLRSRQCSVNGQSPKGAGQEKRLFTLESKTKQRSESSK